VKDRLTGALAVQHPREATAVLDNRILASRGDRQIVLVQNFLADLQRKIP